MEVVSFVPKNPQVLDPASPGPVACRRGGDRNLHGKSGDLGRPSWDEISIISIIGFDMI